MDIGYASSAPRFGPSLVCTAVLGLLYPLAMTGAAQVLLPARADGSLVQVDGRDVASSLIGQAVHPGR